MNYVRDSVWVVLMDSVWIVLRDSVWIVLVDSVWIVLMDSVWIAEAGGVFLDFDWAWCGAASARSVWRITRGDCGADPGSR